MYVILKIPIRSTVMKDNIYVGQSEPFSFMSGSLKSY